MEIIYQDLDWAVPTIKKMVQKKAGLSTIFKDIRSRENFSYFGDIIIFSCIINTLAELNIFKNRDEISYALRKIGEYKSITKTEKNELLDQFCNHLCSTENDSKDNISKQKGGNKH